MFYHRLFVRFGFYEQCQRYYPTEDVWSDFMNACDCLPLCAVVNNSVFAVHAGLSSRLHYVHEIDSIDRFQEIPIISYDLNIYFFVHYFTHNFPSLFMFLDSYDGLFSDILWSDPSPLPGWNPSSRGMSEVFGADITEQFLLDNSLKYIIRGHEVAMDVSERSAFSE